MATASGVDTTTAIPKTDDLLSAIEPIDYVNGPYVASPTSEWESTRLFGGSEMDIRVVLYRDHAAWCPYCHKVQLLLEAKRIPYAIKKENMNSYGSKSTEFLIRNPGGLLPVILLDGELRKESNAIMFLIEEQFQQPHKRMIPGDDNERMQAFHRLMRLERVFTGVWLSALRCPINQYNLAIPPLTEALNIIEGALYEFSGPFFLGTEPSFIDVLYAPILMRASSTLKYFRDLDMCEGRDNLITWFAAMREWEPSRKLMSDDLSYALSIPPQIGTVRFLRERGQLSNDIDTVRVRHILNDGVECKSYRHEAAERLLTNFERVFNDACKGAKIPEAQKSAVDTAMRAVAFVLVDPDQLERIEAELTLNIVEDDRNGVVSALSFMRSRCCAPRDMTADALIQFCGTVNWCVRALGCNE